MDVHRDDDGGVCRVAAIPLVPVPDVEVVTLLALAVKVRSACLDCPVARTANSDHAHLELFGCDIRNIVWFNSEWGIFRGTDEVPHDWSRRVAAPLEADALTWAQMDTVFGKPSHSCFIDLV